jgi:hypothetical protein
LIAEKPLTDLLMTLSASAEYSLCKLDLSNNLLTAAAAPGLQEVRLYSRTHVLSADPKEPESYVEVWLLYNSILAL